MFRQQPRKPEPSLDLDTIRETLDYMQADLSGRAGFENIARALRHAMREIDDLPASHSGRPSRTSDCRVFSARFLPARLTARLTER